MDDLESIRAITTILQPFEPSERARILRWVAERLSIPLGGSPPEMRPTEIAPLEIDPRIELRRALKEERLDRLPELAELLRERGDIPGYVAAGAALAVRGAIAGERILLSALTNEDLGISAQEHAIGSLISYYALTDQSAEKLSVIEPLVQRSLSRQLSPAERAFFLNQLGRLYYSADRREDALRVQTEAYSLNPRELSYAYNLALILDELGRTAEATPLAEAIVKFSSDEDHLRLAARILSQLGDVAKSIEAQNLLKHAELEAKRRARRMATEDATSTDSLRGGSR